MENFIEGKLHTQQPRQIKREEGLKSEIGKTRVVMHMKTMRLDLISSHKKVTTGKIKDSC